MHICARIMYPRQIKKTDHGLLFELNESNVIDWIILQIVFNLDDRWCIWNCSTKYYFYHFCNTFLLFIATLFMYSSRLNSTLKWFCILNWRYKCDAFHSDAWKYLIQFWFVSEHHDLFCMIALFFYERFTNRQSIHISNSELTYTYPYIYLCVLQCRVMRVRSDVDLGSELEWVPVVLYKYMHIEYCLLSHTWTHNRRSSNYTFTHKIVWTRPCSDCFVWLHGWYIRSNLILKRYITKPSYYEMSQYIVHSILESWW